jgi:hypothetical protein
MKYIIGWFANIAVFIGLVFLHYYIIGHMDGDPWWKEAEQIASYLVIAVMALMQLIWSASVLSHWMDNEESYRTLDESLDLAREEIRSLQEQLKSK